jgi:hypothetical protein
MIFVHAATKSFTKVAFASSDPQTSALNTF